jgi:hypothetical protein
VEAEVVGKPSFTTLQSIVALVAGLSSIVGAAYSAVGTFRPAPPPAAGSIAVVVHDAASAAPLPTALVEVEAPDHTLVTTLAHTDGGIARGNVPAGVYHVRVTHPDFVDVVRDVRVVPAGTAQVDVALAHRPHPTATAPHATPVARHAEPTPGEAVDRSIDRSIATGRRLLGRIGF